MKRIIIFLSLLFTIAGCTKDSGFDKGKEEPESGLRQDAFVQGLFRIKVREGAGELDTRAFTRGSSSGMASFDAAATRAGATAVRRVFSEGDRFRERRRKAGLHLWYDVSFAGASLEEAMAHFDGVDGIETVEPVYRMVPDGMVASSAFSYSRAGYAPSFNDPLLKNQWIYNNEGLLPWTVAGADINLFPAWTVSTGHPDVIVAVADGGIQWDHPDLADNMWDDGEGHCGYNFCANNYTITGSAHGTHVAGTVGAVNNNGRGVCGIAGGDGTPGSGVKLMSCQVFPGPGEPDGASFEEILTWSADHGAVISQNSWSYTNATGLSQSAKNAVDYFIKNAGMDENGKQTGPMAGGIIIFSAGNDNSSTPKFPAAYEKIIGVGSIGPDFVKAPESNYGPWVDIVATGGNANLGSEYCTYSTSTEENKWYGYAAGTSMASPQVSGIAALAVAKYGTKAPGFTCEMLWDLLIGSGRRELVERYNPGFEGMFGAGLVDAEYLFFNDTAPQPVTSLATESRRYHVTLGWNVPGDWFDRPVDGFEIFVSAQPLSGSYDDIAAAAEKHTVGNTFGGVGSEAEYTVHNLNPSAKYHFAVVAVSKYGTPSAPVFISAETSLNNLPFVVEPLANIYIQEPGKANIATVDLGAHFSDPDMPTDRLSYFVTYSTGGVAECRLEENNLVITPVGKGSVTLTVNALDTEKAACPADFTVVVGASASGMDLYPNPCRDLLNVRLPEVEGDFSFKMYNQAGQKVIDSSVTVAPGMPGAVDVSKLSPGNYTFVLDCNGVGLKKNIVKR